jgi:hypothetical protein
VQAARFKWLQGDSLGVFMESNYSVLSTNTTGAANGTNINYNPINPGTIHGTATGTTASSAASCGELDIKKLEAICELMEDGLSVEDACELEDIEYEAVKNNFTLQRLVSKSRIKLEHGMLDQLKDCIREQVLGGKANAAGVIWALEHLFPEKYGKGGGADTAMPVNIVISGSAAEAIPEQVEVSV